MSRGMTTRGGEPFLLHPLCRDDAESLRLRVGDVLYRGTTTEHVGGGRFHAHEPSGRLYFSEVADDAAPYGDIEAEGGSAVPVLLEVAIDATLLAALRPGFEGIGEWYVCATSWPMTGARVATPAGTRTTGGDK